MARGFGAWFALAAVAACGASEERPGGDAGMGAGAARDAGGTVDAAAASDVAPPLDRPSADGNGIDAAAPTDARAAADARTAGLPGAVDGVEPEAHSHHPPMCDGRGNLYRITESAASDGNHPRMMRSTNGGASWAEVDAANRPGARDLEGGWQLQHGSDIYSAFTRDDTVWWEVFRTSDAASGADTWGPEEVVDEGLSSSSVVQFVSVARLSTGEFWVFYSDALESGRQQIGYRRRTEAGAYDSKRSLDVASGSWTAPVSVLGAGDTTHIFYKDHLGDRLLHRTLSAAGTLSAATRVDASGTSREAIPHTNAVYYDRAGVEIVVVTFAAADGRLRAVTLAGDAVGAEELVSPDPILEDPEVTTNDGAVAHLAIDGSTVHALFVDAAEGDLWHTARPDAGVWSTPVRAWDSGADRAQYVYAEVHDCGGARRLAFTYDVGPHADDVSSIRYDEIVLR